MGWDGAHPCRARSAHPTRGDAWANARWPYEESECLSSRVLTVNGCRSPIVRMRGRVRGRQGSGDVVSADRAAAAAGGGAERVDRAARRRRVRVRRARSVARAGRRPPSGWRASGLKFTRFHTTALCSPTRAALLSGRNHHTVGMGGITEIATSAPGYNSMRPNTCAPLAETLKLNGYATAQFGKCHEVPVWETSPLGPFDRWPTAAAGSSTSTGSSAARPTSGTRRSTRSTRRSSPTARRSRATTSPRT